MDFFKKVGLSIYDPKFYREIIKQPASFSIKYLVFFSLLFALLITVKFSILVLPKLSSAINKIGPTIISHYPDDLAVTIKGGKVSTNVEEPYFIKLPSSWEGKEDKKSPENLIVIDTKGEPGASSLEKYDTAVLITEKYIVFEEENGKITSNSLAQVPDLMVNKGVLSGLSEKYSPYLKTILPIIIPFVFFFALMYIPLRLVYLVLAALPIWIVAKIKNVPIGYGKSYQMGMHLMTLPIIVVTLIPVKFPLFFTILLIAMAFINLKKFEEKVEESAILEKPIVSVPQEPPKVSEIPPADKV